MTVRFRSFEKFSSRSKNWRKKESRLNIQAIVHKMLRSAELKGSGN